ncbi:MAG: hypothetical protein HQM08_28170 [Candidatus Riflebacteria bacterium]|nr:hypothetical protein [Candidatus Riflebacteria bacterium]
MFKIIYSAFNTKISINLFFWITIFFLVEEVHQIDYQLKQNEILSCERAKIQNQIRKIAAELTSPQNNPEKSAQTPFWYGISDSPDFLSSIPAPFNLNEADKEIFRSGFHLKPLHIAVTDRYFVGALETHNGKLFIEIPDPELEKLYRDFRVSNIILFAAFLIVLGITSLKLETGIPLKRIENLNF